MVHDAIINVFRFIVNTIVNFRPFILDAIANPLSRAAKIAKLSIEEFLEILKDTGIDVVDYPEEELEQDLKNILQKMIIDRNLSCNK